MAATDVETAAGSAAAAVSRRSFKPRYPAWLTAPSLLYYLVFFIAPMGILAAFSVARQSGFASVAYGLDWAQFRAVWDPVELTIFWHTLVMAGTGTLATIVIGYPVAYWISRYLSSYKSLALLLVVVPFWTSFLIRTYSWLIILDPQGYVARGLRAVGLVGRFDVLYTWKAIGIGLVYNYLPLLILPVYSSLERMDWTLVDAATDLGAKPLTSFRQITLRLTLPGLVTGALLVFIPMTGEYVIPALLGGGNFEFVGSSIADQFIGAANWPYGSALSIALMVVLSVFVAVYVRVATREEQFGA